MSDKLYGTKISEYHNQIWMMQYLVLKKYRKTFETETR